MKKIKKIYKFCQKYNIDFNTLFWLIDIIKSSTNSIRILDGEQLNNTMINLNLSELLKEGRVTDKGKRAVLDLLDDLDDIKKPSKNIDDAILELNAEDFVDEYRKLFKGLKMGAMGDRKGCISKFGKFFKEYPEFANKDLILRATKMYISSVNDYRFLKQADYFIYKNDLYKNTVSLLATYCEEVDMDKPEIKDKYEML